MTFPAFDKLRQCAIFFVDKGFKHMNTTKVPCIVCKSTRYNLANSDGICRKCEMRYEYASKKIAKRRGSLVDFQFRDKYKASLNAVTARQGQSTVSKFPLNPLPTSHPMPQQARL
jgi:hypothetical protein